MRKATTSLAGAKWFIAVLLLLVSAAACGNGQDGGAEDAPNLEALAGHDREDESRSEEGADSGEQDAPDSGDLEDFSRDAAALVAAIEETHPIFAMDGMLPEYYEELREEFLAAASAPIARNAFIFAIQRYFTALRDGHMGVNPVFAELDTGFLDAEFEMRDGRLFLAGRPDAEVLGIGGLSVDEIIGMAAHWFFFENESAKALYIPRAIARDAVLAHFGAEFEQRYGIRYVELAVLEDGAESAMRVGILPPVQQQRHQWPDFVIRHEWLDDILLIDLRMFVDGEWIDEAVDIIEDAIAQSARQFIVDLRGNGGGNSLVGQRLVEAMGVEIPHHGAFRRMSPMAQQQRGWNAAEGTVEFAPSAASRNPNGVFVSVLTDKRTFSSSTMMAAWVQDGGFGNIVGEPSANSPSAFGDMLSFALPDSGIDVSISYTRFLRPDASADQDTLWPDIPAPAGDALEVAIRYLRDR